MSNVVNLDPIKAEILFVLREKIKQVNNGEINGLAIISEHLDGYSLEMPGEFSSDADSVSQVIGRLEIVKHFLCSTIIGSEIGDEYE
tara:strand:- start:3788 stop:4048 length:261 start_codon:yes stop_codon:yes gene_type:complete